MGMTALQWPTRRGWSEEPRLWRAVTALLLAECGNMARAEDGLFRTVEGLAETWRCLILCTRICTLMARDGTKSVIAILCILTIDSIWLSAYFQYMKQS